MEKTHPSPWKFFGLTFLFTWICWITAGLLSVGQYGFMSRFLHYAGGVMPTLVTLLLIYTKDTRQAREEYWQRLIGLGRIGKIWHLPIFLTVPVLTSIGILVDLALGGWGATLETASNFIANPLSIVPLTFFLFLFGPLPEEMAWRGYALDQLQQRWNALNASLILGALWTFWHLPLFGILGSYQHQLGLGTTQFWLYMLDKIPQSVIITWIYNNNLRSTLSAVLFHFMVNFTGELFDLSLRAEFVYIISWWLMAGIVIAIWKPNSLARMRDIVRKSDLIQ